MEPTDPDPLDAGLPADPFGLLPPASDEPGARFRPAARRQVEVFGTPAELLWLPERKARRGVPTGRRAPFQAEFVGRILAEETLWRRAGVAMTPNRFPFAERQLVLWAEERRREPDASMLELAFALAERVDGTALLNATGAAASITRAHMHVVGDRLEFLRALPFAPFRPDYLFVTRDDVAAFADLDVRRLDPALDFELLELRGPRPVRAAAAHRLLLVRTTPAFNIVSEAERTWFLPRSSVEIPAPHFPHALGAAEVWGRWCFGDEGPFRDATTADLERALVTSGVPCA